MIIKSYVVALSLLTLILLVVAAAPHRAGVGADAAAPPQGVEPQVIKLESVLEGLTSPLYVTSARDGTNRLFIVERAGVIKVLRQGATTPTVFLDVVSKVLSGGERGLLGLAFHPQYSTNRRFFVNYTRKPDGATVIAEYQASATNQDLAEATEKVLLVIAQPFANHNGGMIEFGPDGFLYIGMGDGGSANDPGNRAQNVEELLGKMLRIDIDHPDGSTPYSSPADNPFAGPAPGRDEIYAVGFRNPWRFSFDRATGALYAGDVGQAVLEEIDVVGRGGNYGWRVFEGTRCTDKDPALCNDPGRYVAPIAEYSHTDGRCSISGGYVYRGSRGSLPVGAYLYGDFCTGEIFMLKDGVQTRLLGSGLRISSFGEDEAGEIYVVNLDGSLHRIAAAAATTALTLSPNVVTGGKISTATFTLGEPAPAGGAVVQLTSSNQTVATVPSRITIPAGANSGSFVVKTKPVTATTSVSISAASSVGTRTTTLTVQPPVLTELRLSRTSVTGPCQTTTAKLFLSGEAPAGGVAVTLTNNHPAADVPDSITIAPGATFASFIITVSQVLADTTGTITATPVDPDFGTDSYGETLKVRPIKFKTLTLAPNPVTGPNTVTGTLVLTCPAPAGGQQVLLSTSNAAVARPVDGLGNPITGITVAAGQTTASFRVQANDVSATSNATITAKMSGVSKTVKLTVN